MPSNARQRYIVFRLAGESYALSLGAVDEIIPMTELACPPCAPDYLSGFLAVGGEPVAVVSLRVLFGLPKKASRPHTPLMLIKESSPRLALEVDRVTRIVRATDSELLPIGGCTRPSGGAIAVLAACGEHALLLAPQQILPEDERAQLADLEHLERSRLVAVQNG